METILEFCGEIGGFLWGPWTFFVLMGAGLDTPQILSLLGDE